MVTSFVIFIKLCDIHVDANDLTHNKSKFRKQSRRCLVTERRFSNDPDSDIDTDDPIEDIIRFHRHLLRPRRQSRGVNWLNATATWSSVQCICFWPC